MTAHLAATTGVLVPAPLATEPFRRPARDALRAAASTRSAAAAEAGAPYCPTRRRCPLGSTSFPVGRSAPGAAVADRPGGLYHAARVAALPVGPVEPCRSC